MDEKETSLTKYFRRGYSQFKDPQSVFVLLLFLTHFFLVFYDFFPNLKDINFWDEAIYVNWGRILVDGNLPTFSQNPLLAIFYGILYLPFSKSPYWLVQICSLGRLIMFGMIWLSSYLAARTLSHIFDRSIFAGFLLVNPLATEILGNPSDAIFTAMSAFAFWQLLLYWKEKQLKSLLLSSLFVGLGALSRNDGLVLFAIFTVLSLLIGISQKLAWKNIFLGLLPFALLVGGYIGISGVITGDFSTGAMQRSYVAFEQGHAGVYQGGGIHSHTIDAMLDARRVFGTPEENNYSVLRAIRRNPAAYFEHLKLIVKRLPEQVLNVYNKKMAALIFLLALRGIVALISKKQYSLLAMLIAWPLYLATYFLTFFRDGYLRSPFFILFILAGVGMQALFDNLDKKIEKWIAASILSLIVIVSLNFNKLAIYYGAVIFLAAMWLVFLLRKRFQAIPEVKSLSLLVLLIFGFVLHGNYSAPKIQRLGINADERAAVYLMENYPPKTKVGAGSPGVVWMAKQEFLAITGSDVPAFKESRDFHQWLINEGIEVIYLDYSISNLAPYFWELIQMESGVGLTEVFNENVGSNRIYNVNPVRNK